MKCNPPGEEAKRIFALALSPKRYEAYEEISDILYQLGKDRDDEKGRTWIREPLEYGQKAKALKEGRALSKQ